MPPKGEKSKIGKGESEEIKKELSRVGFKEKHINLLLERAQSLPEEEIKRLKDVFGEGPYFGPPELREIEKKMVLKKLVEEELHEKLENILEKVKESKLEEMDKETLKMLNQASKSVRPSLIPEFDELLTKKGDEDTRNPEWREKLQPELSDVEELLEKRKNLIEQLQGLVSQAYKEIEDKINWFGLGTIDEEYLEKLKDASLAANSIEIFEKFDMLPKKPKKQSD